MAELSASAPLTVCVMGRDEARNLPRLQQSLRALDRLPFPFETLYVDSASSDQSVTLARRSFDRVYVLVESEYLCAAAGRYLGTLRARGNWVMYLDGDMEMCDEWITVLEEVCLDSGTSPAGFGGLVGRRRNVYEDGSTREFYDAHRKKDLVVRGFGGAALLRRRCVLDAGNWQPSISGNEELDLHSRMMAKGCRVFHTEADMMNHFTLKLSIRSKLVGTVAPERLARKKFYGFGQVVHARLAERSLWGLVRAAPEPFTLWTGILLAGFLLAARQTILAGCLSGVTVTFVWMRRGASYIAVAAGMLVLLVTGFGRYEASYVPRVARTYSLERP